MLAGILKWLGGLVALTVVLVTLWLAAFGWNSLRGPIIEIVSARTGRELVINGDLQVGLDWPSLKVSVADVKFGNPPWASRKHLFLAKGIDLSIKLPALLRGKVVLDQAALREGDIFLEVTPDGEKNWVLEPDRKKARPPPTIERLIIDKSRIAYDDPLHRLSVVADVTNQSGDAATGLSIQVKGRYRDTAVAIAGSGGPLLALRDQGTPYPFKLEGTSGSIKASAEGTINGIRGLTGIDAKVAIAGGNLAELFPLVGIALPETERFRTSGRLLHRSGSWLYQDFSAHIGSSDGTGSLEIDTSKKPTTMRGELRLGRLDFADLGPVIGHRKPPATPRGGAGKPGKTQPKGVLPDRPFRTERWNSVDADIKIHADTIIRNPRLPVDRLSTRLRLRDRVLTLDPLEFGVAGGRLIGSVNMDGRQDPIHARLDLVGKGIVFERLFPTAKLKNTKVGKVNGKLELSGKGNSVAHMLGNADGRVGLVVDGGEISRLSMEMADLHVLETIALKIGGDKPIRIRCGMADLVAKDGIMRVEQLVFDTEITNINGTGSIDFGQEALDLTLTPESKKPSLIAFRSPIFVRGSFGQPEVDVDKKRIAIRGLGAVALGAANPLLALAPLIEAGPGEDSDCGRLLQEMRQKTR